MAGLKLAPQGVDCPTGEFLAGGLDETTDGTAGGGMPYYTTNREGNGQGADGAREEGSVNPPTTRGDGPGNPRGA